MSRPQLQPSKNLRRNRGYISGTSTTAAWHASQETLLDSATKLLRISQTTPKEASLRSSRTLRIVSGMLHSALIGIHLILVAVWKTGLEHRLVFPLEQQKIVSFLITAIATSFATIYCAGLVFVTQILSMRRSLHMNQTLTATHDNAVAWAGFGSAFAQIWHQKSGSASVIGVISVFLYLGNIALLHVTIAGSFSLESFNATRPLSVVTQGLPAFDWSNVDVSDPLARGTLLADTILYAYKSLYFLPSILGSNTTLGLYDGTLYDVPEPIQNESIGNITVNATGFNITCRYITGVRVLGNLSDGSQLLNDTHGMLAGSRFIPRMEPGMIVNEPRANNSQYTLLYSTVPIADSSGTVSSPIDGSAPSIYLLECSQALVSQTAVLEARSRQLISVAPSMQKTVSTWSALEADLSAATPTSFSDFVQDDLSLVNSWSSVYSQVPDSLLPLMRLYNGTNPKFASIADLYMMQTLNLLTSDLPTTVSLPDIENILSTIVASMFWTVGNARPLPQWYVEYNFTTELTSVDKRTTTTFDVVTPNTTAPRLLQASASITEEFVQTRLDFSIIAIAVGLGASIVLTALSLPSLRLPKRLKTRSESDEVIDGTGILHAIWLFRNNPELQTQLEQVEHPSDNNLRAAGMVETRLVGGRGSQAEDLRGLGGEEQMENLSDDKQKGFLHFPAVDVLNQTVHMSSSVFRGPPLRFK
ncbi:hypothetical protein MVEN_01706500 [Mycena venus]|uniref:Uncharacterized protein n=1 Tax=Mycena venus TaxID=2733690 RepID=A0A8H6XM22_9AGAR|nr:hypothetical protein MVEN_01706500 [Mycena venus]